MDLRDQDENLTGQQRRGLISCCLVPRSLVVRFFVLFTASTFFFTCTALDDLVSAAVPTLKKSMHLSSQDISILYSSTPVVAIFASLVTSLVVGRVSIRTLTLFSCFCILLGNSIFIHAPGFWPKVFGRAVFGIGEGPLEVLMTLICMRWFTENDPIAPTLEFSFGVTSAAGMLGAAAGLNGIPFLLEKLAPFETYAYSIVNFVSLFAWVLAVAYFDLDYWASPLLDKDDGDGEPVEQPSMWTVLKSLSLQYWLLFVMCGTLWSMIYVIMVFLTDYLSEKWGYSNLSAGNWASLVFLIGTPVSVITGWFVGRFGKVLTILVLGASLFTFSCLLLGLTKIHPIIGIAGIGVATGFYEPTVFASIAKVLPEEGSDAAFTLTSLIFQFVVFLGPIGFGFLRDLKGNYDLIFILCSLVGLANVGLTFWLGASAPHLQDDNVDQDIVMLENILDEHFQEHHKKKQNEDKMKIGILSVTLFALHLLGVVANTIAWLYVMIKKEQIWLIFLGIAKPLGHEDPNIFPGFCLVVSFVSFISCILNFRQATGSKLLWTTFIYNAAMTLLLFLSTCVFLFLSTKHFCPDGPICEGVDLMWLIILTGGWLTTTQLSYFVLSLGTVIGTCLRGAEEDFLLSENEVLLEPTFESQETASEISDE